MKPKFRKGTWEKAMEIVQALEKGTDLASLHAKRLKYNRDLISVKIGDHVRVLYNSVTKAYRVLTHQEYNKVISGPKD